MKERHGFDIVNGDIWHHHSDGTYATVERTGTRLYTHGVCTDCGEERVRPSNEALIAAWLLSVGLVATITVTTDGTGFAAILLSFVPVLAANLWPDYVVTEGDRDE